MLWWILTDVNRQMILIQANNLNYLFYARDNDGLKNRASYGVGVGVVAADFFSLKFNGNILIYYDFYLVEVDAKILTHWFAWCDSIFREREREIAHLSTNHHVCVFVLVYCFYLYRYVHGCCDKEEKVGKNRKKSKSTTNWVTEKIVKNSLIIMSLELKCVLFLYFNRLMHLSLYFYGL